MSTTPGTDVAVRPPRLPQPELDQYARLGTWLAALESGKDDPTSKGAAAALRFYYAEQLELPATAVSELSVINGKLFVGAQLLRALAGRAGYRVGRLDSTDKTCTAVLLNGETGEELGRTTFTIEDAKSAGMIRARSAWETHPARMLWARASTYVIRDFAPAVSLGMYADDEIAEVIGEPPLDDDPNIPFGDSYQDPVEAETIEQLEAMAQAETPT
jgi:hypothetical protein